ncbi:MAG: T9SS type A sorting domain-containing protein [Bacteroidetes bacterium]|nr:T9SS type A sorting domain-containing protein [Bacteroidota bacterium]
MKLFIFFILALTTTFPGIPAKAQTWQWGNAVSFDSTGASNPTISLWHRSLVDMATDESGNVYSLILANSRNLKVAGQSETGFGKYDILLSSFSCEGHYRWSRLIGTSSDSDVSVSVKASTESGVFVSGFMNMALAGGGHFSTDTTVVNPNKTMFLAKWDTAGHLQWLRMPQPATMNHDTAWALSQPADMILSKEGAVYLLTLLSPGVYAEGSYPVHSLGMHILKYSSNGQFLGGIQAPILPTPSVSNFIYVYNLALSSFQYDEANNRFIIQGGTTVTDMVSIGGTSVGFNSSFVVSFSALNGTLIWSKVSNPLRQTPNPTSFVQFPRHALQLDAQGNVYVDGFAADSAYFNGVLFRNAQHTIQGVHFVMKMDAATGNVLWINSNNHLAGNDDIISGMALVNHKLAITGRFKDSLSYPGGLLTNNPLLDKEDAYIIQFDTQTGKLQKMTALSGPSNSFGSSIVADRRGNFYVGGTYNDAAQAIGPDTLSLDNFFNFFVAKWGWANCSCTPPVAALVQSAASGMYRAYTYTGTIPGLDSLVWDFGDGSTQKITSGYYGAVLHTYSVNGHYNVCVTAYNESCGGSSTACLPLALSVGNLPMLDDFRIYPNPASEAITVEGAQGAKLKLYNMLGQQMGSFHINAARQMIPIENLPDGIYTLRITDANRHTGVMRITKQ